jgi:hypothetical protein
MGDAQIINNTGKTIFVIKPSETKANHFEILPVKNGEKADNVEK